VKASLKNVVKKALFLVDFSYDKDQSIYMTVQY